MQHKRKKIGICIDGVLRDYKTSMLRSYDRLYNTNYLESDSFANLKYYEVLVNLPFDGEEDIEDFIHTKSLDIFGNSDCSYQAVFSELSQLISILSANFDIALIFKYQWEITIPATLYFLSNNGCKAKEIVSIYQDSNPLDYCDILITDTIDNFITTNTEKEIIVFDENNESDDTKIKRLKELLQILNNKFVNNINN